MTELWYNNLSVLFENANQFFPSNNLTTNQKVNAIARLSIYYSIIISTILIFSAIVYYLNIKNQRALRSLGVSYLPVAGVPPPYSEDNDENDDDENITNA